jgi:hypothetical protein
VIALEGFFAMNLLHKPWTFTINIPLGIALMQVQHYGDMGTHMRHIPGVTIANGTSQSPF